MKKAIIRFDSLAQMQRLFGRPDLERFVNALGIVAVFRDRRNNITLSYSERAPDWIASCLRRWGATKVYIHQVLQLGIELLIENPYLGEKSPENEMGFGPPKDQAAHTYDPAALRDAYRKGLAEEIIARTTADCAPTTLDEALSIVDRQMSGGLLLDPALLTDESLDRHIEALLAEKAKRPTT